MVFGSAFLAGAFVFWNKHDLRKALMFGSAFLARACVFWENMPKEKYVSRVGVPSRGFCFLFFFTCPEQTMSLGLPFLAGALVFLGKKHAQTKAMSLGSAFLAGAFVF